MAATNAGLDKRRTQQNAELNQRGNTVATEAHETTPQAVGMLARIERG
jgi:hypothetical protein